MDPDEVLTGVMRESGIRLLRLAYQLCHDRSLAEDLVQEALTTVYVSWRRRRPDLSSAEGYVRKAVVNEYLRRRRLRSSTEVVTAAPVSDDARRPDEHGLEAGVVERDQLWSALGRLSARQRTVLVLRYYEDVPDRQIAQILGCREATVRSIALRALGALRGIDLVGDPQ